MKKYLCLILILMFTVLMAGICFAATDEIDDPLVPTSPNTTTELQYGETEIEIEDEDPPESAEIMEISDEDIPEAAPASEITGEILPQTGGIPAFVFYALGGVCIVSALLLLRKKPNTSEK